MIVCVSVCVCVCVCVNINANTFIIVFVFLSVWFSTEHLFHRGYPGWSSPFLYSLIASRRLQVIFSKAMMAILV